MKFSYPIISARALELAITASRYWPSFTKPVPLIEVNCANSPPTYHPYHRLDLSRVSSKTAQSACEPFCPAACKPTHTLPDLLFPTSSAFADYEPEKYKFHNQKIHATISEKYMIQNQRNMCNKIREIQTHSHTGQPVPLKFRPAAHSQIMNMNLEFYWTKFADYDFIISTSLPHDEDLRPNLICISDLTIFHFVSIYKEQRVCCAL